MIQPERARSLLLRAQRHLSLGQLAEARSAAAAAEQSAGDDAQILDAVGTLFSRANDHGRALQAYERAVRLAPNDPRFLFNRATVRRFVGALAEAEADYDRVIALDPTDCEAYRNRADLRTQTLERNHTAELEALLAQGVREWHAQVQLRFALAKEYEDLGAYAQSFEHLQRGARLRREHLRYDVAVDVATVDWLIEAFPAAVHCEKAALHRGQDGAGDSPIFIVGLPRSGSTLVDRILSSHSAITSAGELNCFALAVVEAASRQLGTERPSRRELVAQSARLDFASLGRDYLARARAAGATGARFTDKMPLNHLYCGLIHRALPRSRIIHVSRAPMAACYAIYKTLFDSGYPYSYDLEELGRYYIAYHRLMQHWRATLPGTICDVSYEALIADPRAETRRLLEFCELGWDEACLEFHRNPAPTTTASAAQVRKPLYRTSVELWRHYRVQLQPLSRQLAEAGIPEAST
ncbi:MAG TPA: sulfotransferase [Steroidobacteraceae bacterium]|nr:sulfotransferase [Steroidobacteraceae bacterium]